MSDFGADIFDTDPPPPRKPEPRARRPRARPEPREPQGPQEAPPPPPVAAPRPSGPAARSDDLDLSDVVWGEPAAPQAKPPATRPAPLAHDRQDTQPDDRGDDRRVARERSQRHAGQDPRNPFEQQPQRRDPDRDDEPREAREDRHRDDREHREDREDHDDRDGGRRRRRRRRRRNRDRHQDGDDVQAQPSHADRDDRGAGRGQDHDRSDDRPAPPRRRPAPFTPPAIAQAAPERIGLLVDVIALEAEAQKRGGELSFRRLHEGISGRRPVVRAVCYVAASGRPAAVRALEKAGFEVRIASTEQAMSVTMAVDALALAQAVDVVVLAPGSSDLAAVVQALHQHSVRVETAGFEPAGFASDRHLALGRECFFVP